MERSERLFRCAREEVRPTGTKNAVMERRRARALRKGRSRRKAWTKMLRLAALHPLGILLRERKLEAGVPVPLKNRGDDA
jgi:hypothetical protein